MKCNPSLIFLSLLFSCFSLSSQTYEEKTMEDYISIARVVKNDKVGYINGEGEEIIPVEFDEGDYFFYENRITLRQGENWYIYDVHGKLLLDLQDRYKFVGLSGDDLFFVSNKVERIVTKDHSSYRNFDLSEIQFIDILGVEKFVIKPKSRLSIEYPRSMRYVNGYLKLSIAACEWCANKLVGFADTSGRIVIEPQFHDSWYGQDFSEGLSKTPNMPFEGEQRTYSTCKYGFINPKGEWVIDTLYSSHPIQGFTDGASIVDLSTIVPSFGGKLRNKANLFAINAKGKRLFAEDIKFQSGGGIKDSVMILTKMIDDTLMFALGNTKGELLTNFIYEFMMPAMGKNDEGYGHYFVMKGKDSFYVSNKGREIRFEAIKMIDGRFRNYEDGLSLFFGDNRLSGVIDMDGKVIIPMSSKRLSIEGGLIREDIFIDGSKKRKKQYYDRKGQAIQMKDYDRMREFEFIKLQANN